jgi:hypothetical protein
MTRPPRPIVFLHVPKTGGTTVRHQLKAWFPGASHVQFEGPEAWDGMTDREIREYDLFTGHIGFRFVRRVPGALLVTFLRDPFERALSQFYYHKHDVGTFGDQAVRFGDYLRSEIRDFREVLDNGIVWQFAWDQYLPFRDRARFADPDSLYRAAIANTADVDFVGFQETLDADLARLGRLLGCDDRRARVAPANRTTDKPVDIEVSTADRALFSRMASLDERFVAEVRQARR